MPKKKASGDTDSPPWPDVYAELKNKIRWAIGSTAAETGVINLPFRQQVDMAGPLAQTALEQMQELYAKPDLRIVAN